MHAFLQLPRSCIFADRSFREPCHCFFLCLLAFRTLTCSKELYGVIDFSQENLPWWHFLHYYFRDFLLLKMIWLCISTTFIDSGLPSINFSLPWTVSFCVTIHQTRTDNHLKYLKVKWRITYAAEVTEGI